MNFNTKNTKETSGSKWIAPGVENDVVIMNVMGVAPEGERSPFIEFTFKKSTSEDDDNTKTRFYMTEKSSEMSMKKILHLCTKVVKRAQIDALTANSVEEYGALLNRLIAGKHLRLKFLGEEYINAKSEVKIKPVLGLPTFAEAIMEGAEYPAVANSATKLTFDTTKDIIRIKNVPASDSTIVGVEDDLPF